MSDLHISKLVGSSRTYVYTGGKGLDARAWMDGLDKGRAFMSTGPLIGLTVNGKMPGDEMTLPPAGGTVDGRRLGEVDHAARKSDRSSRTAKLLAQIPLAGDRKSVEFTRQFKVRAAAGFTSRRKAPLPSGIHSTLGSRRRSPTRSGSLWATSRCGNLARPTYCIKWIDKLKIARRRGPRLAIAERKRPRVRAVRRGAADLQRFAQEAAAAEADHGRWSSCRSAPSAARASGHASSLGVEA